MLFMIDLVRFSIISLVLFFFAASPVFATTYGSGTYGGGVYNSGSTTTTTSPSVASSVSTAITTFFCTEQAPSAAPNLYQIDVTSTTATIYFSPAGGPYDKHYISFGQGNNNEGNGVEFSTQNAKGALTYQIGQLTPGTVYTVRIRGGNGCKPGPWSNDMTIKTQRKGGKAVTKFYANKQKNTVQSKLKNPGKVVQPSVKQSLSVPSSAAKSNDKKQKGPTPEHAAKSEQMMQDTHQQQSSLWGGISSFFGNLFKY